MDVLTAIHSRRSIRSYADTSVSEEVLHELIEAGHMAPTSCNLQLTEFIVITDLALKRKLAETVTGKFNWAPTYIIFMYDPRFTVEHAASVVSVGASMQNILLAATARGLVACPMAGFHNDEGLKKMLGVPRHYEVVLVMSVGYESGTEKKIDIAKVPFTHVMHFNRYDNTKHHVLNDSLDLKDWNFEALKSYRERLAPVYLYPGRFNLNTYPLDFYRDAFKVLTRDLLHGKRVLDFLSYDGTFAALLAREGNIAHLGVSDCIAHSMRTFATVYPKTYIHQFKAFGTLDATRESYDMVTFVHKAEFTPELDQVCAEAYRVLVPGGKLFVVSHIPSTILRIVYLWRRLLLRLRGKVVNVYEHNKSYKIGPVRYVPVAILDRVVEGQGFRKIKGGPLERHQVNGRDAFTRHGYWVLYEK